MRKIISTILTICFSFLPTNSLFTEATFSTVNFVTDTPHNVSIEDFCQNVPSLNWSNLLNGSFLFSGGKCTLNRLFAFIASAGSIAWGISQIHSLKYCYDDVKEFCGTTKNWLKAKLPSSHIDPTNSISSLKSAFKEIKGQETPKSTIKQFLYMIVHDKNLAKINNYDYNHADVMLFIGASGVGKTLAAIKIAQSLKVEPLILSAADVDRHSEETLIDQLFGLDIDNYGYNSSLKKSKSLAKYLKSHKNGVIIINESDKLNPKGELDEILRGAMDNGIVNIKGQIFDFSGTLIILTSNESSSCVNKGNFTLLNPSDEEDGTGSRTIALHDKSFLNRVKVVEFNNLTQKEYFEIAQKEFSEKVINYWEQYAKVELIIDDNTFESIATKAELENKGARYLEKIRSNLVKEIIEKINSTECPPKLFIYYDNQSNKFELSTQPIADYYHYHPIKVPATAPALENNELSKTPEANTPLGEDTTLDKNTTHSATSTGTTTSSSTSDSMLDKDTARDLKTA